MKESINQIASFWQCVYSENEQKMPKRDENTGLAMRFPLCSFPILMSLMCYWSICAWPDEIYVELFPQ